MEVFPLFDSQVFDKSYLLKKTILNLLMQKKTLSRTALSAMIGIRPSTITEITRELLQEGSVCEVGSLHLPGSDASRRDLTLNPNYRRLLGVDIQVGYIACVLTDFCGTILSRKLTPLSESASQEEILSLVYESIDAMMQQAGAVPILGIGVSTIGILDRSTDTILLTFSRLDWNHVRLRELLAARYPAIPVYLEDQVVCRLYYEQWFLAQDFKTNSVFVDIGSVTGCSAFFNGKILKNEAGISGEIGHFAVGNENVICSCGNANCLQTVASASVVLKKVHQTLERNTISALNDMTGRNLEHLTLQMVLDAAARNDRVAINVLTTAALYVGRAVAYIINLLGPKRVILGGEMITGSDFFFRTVVDETLRLSLCLIADSIEFCRASPSEYAAATGAVCMPLEDFFRFPDFSRAICSIE